MYFLSSTEISKLAKEAEAFVKQQRQMQIILRGNPVLQKLIVPENPYDIAKHILKNIHHLNDDIANLVKAIEVNLTNTEHFNSNC